MPPPVRKLSQRAMTSFRRWEGRRLHRQRLFIQAAPSQHPGENAADYHSSPASCQRLSFSGSVDANALR